MADLEQVASDLNSASQSLQELREKYDGALDLLDNKNTEITAALESAKSNALQEVQTASNTATSQISQLKDASLNAVNEAKNTATTEISSKKEETLGEFSQATSEFNSTKEEALSQIEQAKTEQGEKITALEQAKESITADLNKKVKILTENLTWTIGSGQETATHFNTLEKAINEALKYTKQNNLTITLQLTEDLTLTQVLVFSFCDCRNIVIDGQNFTIQKNMISPNDIMFQALYSAFLPRFNNITFKNTGSNNNGVCFQVYHNSNLNLHGLKYVIDNFFTGIDVAASSSVNIFNNTSKIINCQKALQCYALGKIDARSITIENNNLGISFIAGGGLVDISLATLTSNTSDCNIAFNTLTPQGICFKQ